MGLGIVGIVALLSLAAADTGPDRAFVTVTKVSAETAWVTRADGTGATIRRANGSWDLPPKPLDEALQVGQRVEVAVLPGRVAILSLKALQPHPFETFKLHYPAGSQIDLDVVQITAGRVRLRHRLHVEIWMPVKSVPGARVGRRLRGTVEKLDEARRSFTVTGLESLNRGLRDILGGGQKSPFEDAGPVKTDGLGTIRKKE